MTRFVVAVFMVAATAASADDPQPAREEAKRPCLAVLDFFVSGKIDASGSRAAAALVRKEVNAAGKYDLIDRQMMVERMGEKDFAATTECNQLACLVLYGKSLAVDKIVGGSMVSLGESWLIEMRMVDVNTGREEKTFAKRHKGGMDDLLDLVVEGADDLLAIRPTQAPKSGSNKKVGDAHMKLGNFSVSLAVKDLAASRAFYEKLGFRQVGGDAKKWSVLQNESATIGLFQGMFEKNALTFNPGWDRTKATLPDFDDVRDIQKTLKSKGLTPTVEADESTTGPAFLTLTDPDGNPVLIDQHVPAPKK